MSAAVRKDFIASSTPSSSVTAKPEWMGRIQANWLNISSGNNKYNQRLEEKLVESFGLSPTEIYAIVKMGLPEGIQPKIALERKGKKPPKYELKLSAYDRDDKEILSDARVFTLGDERTATRGNIVIKSMANKGKSIGRQFMFNQLRLLRAFGVETIEANIASYNGAYTWSRMGFKVDRNSYIDDSCDEILRRIKNLKPYIGEDESADLLARFNALSKNDAYISYKIAQWDEPLNNVLGDNKSEVLRRACLPEEVKRFFADKELKLGQYLLCGLSIHSFLDMNDDRQMALLERYCGRCFETGEPFVTRADGHEGGVSMKSLTSSFSVLPQDLNVVSDGKPEWAGQIIIKEGKGCHTDVDDICKICRDAFECEPQELYDIMKKGFPSGYRPKIFIEAFGRRCDYFDIRTSLKDREGNSLISYSRDVTLGKRKRAKAGRVTIDDCDRHGQGCGRQFMFNHMRLMKAIGVQTLEAYLSQDNGAYTWSKMGYKIAAQTNWKDIHSDIHKRLRILSGYIGEDAVQPFIDRFEAMEPEDPYMFYKIAHWDTSLDEALGDDKHSLILEANIFRDAEFYLMQRTMTVGQYLLCSLSVDGCFDLNDNEQLKRLERYCGRCFETGEFLPCQTPQIKPSMRVLAKT